MKQVYTYSPSQFNLNMEVKHYINDKPFTQQQSFEDDQEVDFAKMNDWNDNSIIHVSENLPIDDVYLKVCNHRIADTSQEKIKYVIQ